MLYHAFRIAWTRSAVPLDGVYYGSAAKMVCSSSGVAQLRGSPRVAFLGDSFFVLSATAPGPKSHTGGMASQLVSLFIQVCG